MGQQKPEVIVLTDIGGDTDDEQSLVRFLYYADQFEIKAICATSRLGHGQDIKPELINGHLDAYRAIYPNLLLHTKEFPHPDKLMGLVKNGQGNSRALGEGFDSEASEAIISIVDESENTIQIPVWGGLRELAQALWKVKNNRTKAELDHFCSKIQVHAIGDQDGHRDYILKNFKSLRFIASGYAWYGFTGVVQLSSFRGMYMTGNQQMQDAEWVKTNIHGNGPLSDRYQLNGHGTDGMKEGDSPSFLGLIGNGLNVPEHPEWGGWGGRYRQLTKTLFIDAPDFMEGTLNERHGVARWRTAFQSDFMARAKWAVLPFGQANHNPVVMVNDHKSTSPLYINAQPGKDLELDATASVDPDGDSLTFSWWVYNEIFQPVNSIDFNGTATNSKLKIKVPPMAPGKQLHLILEVTDKGLPALTSYKRVIITATI
ncbi:putative protein-signal peptide and transmembrane prediction [Cyclobacterium qasimii M12-11B]|nr:putative protein-signal peptide and transmembrane prediction [Cyclobacterium qasimii M12-11B]